MSKSIESIKDIKESTRATLDARLWSKSSYHGPTQCIEWTGANREGYGSMLIQTASGAKKSVSVHRLAYLLVHGFLSCHVGLHHSCHNTLCINVRHLRPFRTQTEHYALEKLRKDYKKRQFYKPISMEDVDFIVALVAMGYNNTSIARATGYTRGTIKKYRRTFNTDAQQQFLMFD